MGLINQIAKGDMGALEDLYNEHKTYVFHIALTILRDTYLAEDAAQETFIRIQNNAGKYRFGISEKAWITAITRNIAIDMLRKRKYEVVREEQELEEQPVFPEDKLEFLSIIQVLDETDREIVCMRIITGLKHREIAQILKLNTNTVKKRYERALGKLANGMKEVG